jgi:hypothetical protein
VVRIVGRLSPCPSVPRQVREHIQRATVLVLWVKVCALLDQVEAALTQCRSNFDLQRIARRQNGFAECRFLDPLRQLGLKR